MDRGRERSKPGAPEAEAREPGAKLLADVDRVKLPGKDNDSNDSKESKDKDSRKSLLSRGAAMLYDCLYSSETSVEASASRDRFIERTTGLLKAGALFSAGRGGAIATAAFYALDQINPNDKIGLQVVDGTLGIGQGLLTRKMFGFIGRKKMTVVGRGMFMGAGGTLIESGLSRRTYLDSQEGGRHSISNGLLKTLDSAVDGKALALNAGVFAGAHGLSYLAMKGAMPATRWAARQAAQATGAGGRAYRVEKVVDLGAGSSVLRTAINGATFGMTSGGANEILRQMETGKYDAAGLGKEMLLSGLLDGAAAAFAPACGSLKTRLAHASRVPVTIPGDGLAYEYRLPSAGEAVPAAIPGRREQQGGRNAGFKITRAAGDKSYEELEKLSLRYDQNDIEEFNKCSARIRASHTESRSLPQPKSGVSGPFASVEDFKARALSYCGQTMRVYVIEPYGTKLVIPADYAGQLDEVRILRRVVAERSTAARRHLINRDNHPGAHRKAKGAGMVPVDQPTISIEQYLERRTPQEELADTAQIRLQEVHDRLRQHLLWDHPIPEDYLAMLDRLPDARLVKEIRVFNCKDPYAAFNEQIYEPGFKAAATASLHDGVINFFQPRCGSFFKETVPHEWLHLAEHHLFADSNSLFGLAAEIEHNGYYSRHYGRYNPQENLAVLAGEELLHEDPDRFHHAASAAPLRSVVASSTIFAPVLSKVPSKEHGPCHETLLNRVAWLRENISPRARHVLLKEIGDSSSRLRPQAARLLIALEGGGSQWVNWLPRVPRLEELDLTGISLTDKQTRYLGMLSTIPGLRTLLLGHNSIGDKTAPPLGVLTGLRRLDLSSTNITDASIPYIRKLKGIHELNLHGTLISDKGVAQLRDLPELYRIDIDGDGISDRSARHIGLINSLQALSIRGSDITDEAIDHLSRLPFLRNLELNYTYVTDAAVPRLVQMQNLWQLSLHDADVTDKGLRLLAQMDRLHTLGLSQNTQISDKGITYLNSLRQLAKLDLSDVSGLTGAGIAKLDGLKQLESLSLERTRVDDGALLQIACNQRNLQELNVHGCKCITDDGFSTLDGHPNLKKIDLSYTAADDRTAAYLRTIRNLEDINMAGTAIGDEGIFYLMTCHNLRRLNLESTRITDAALKAFSTRNSMTRLEEIDLRYCKLSLGAVANLRLALPHTRIVF